MVYATIQINNMDVDAHKHPAKFRTKGLKVTKNENNLKHGRKINQLYLESIVAGFRYEFSF